MTPPAGPYSRLSPSIREYIYREKWRFLWDIQEAAINEIFDGGGHLLIAAGTAAGKTEAAFFPILSALEEAGQSGGPRPLVLYISPLKALINDQARRLGKMIRSGGDSGGGADIALWPWHGDVDGDRKNHFLEAPSGILLITPESLESLLLRRGRELGRIFGALAFTVIDEVHVFMGSDRGAQLSCQLARIEGAVRAAGGPLRRVRRVGLSATLGDYEGARRWLALGGDLPTVLIRPSKPAGREIRVALDYHSRRDGGFYRSLYAQCRNKRSIIFTNSRLEAEECAASLRTLALSLGEPDIFHVHHGNVAAPLRGETEARLKAGQDPQAVCATATLELGIDIGGLDRIIQLGAPWSVSAFVQRLGRSGRRGGGAEIYFSVPDQTASPGGNRLSFPEKDPAAIPWELLRTMAVIELYLRERWIEPPEEKPLPYSLLLHQALSVLASLGEQRPEDLIRRVLSLPPFTGVPPEDFRALLVWLTGGGYIQKTGEGTFILGLEGERIVNRHGFYSVFPGEEEFRVMLEGREIGTIHFAPDPLSVLVVGGRRWLVKSVDSRRREVWVGETSDAGGERLWRGRGGAIHRRIAETARFILEGGAPAASCPCLSPAAREALERGRLTARRLGLTGAVLAGEGESGETGAAGEGRTLFLFPWEGSPGTRTIEAVLKSDEARKALRIFFLEAEREMYFRIGTKLGIREFRPALAEVCKKALESFEGDPLSPEGNRGLFGPRFRETLPRVDKYDHLLPPELLVKQYIANALDPGALRRLERAVRQSFKDG
ncbi:MAG: DEAD/DEAH box helicase [Treponema sp.]|jgi:ATP-dependent Lhr-like helicase|nr:DEAD/DEAH box helicase [Treponema sp.]